MNKYILKISKMQFEKSFDEVVKTLNLKLIAKGTSTYNDKIIYLFEYDSKLPIDEVAHYVGRIFMENNIEYLMIEPKIFSK